MTRVAVDALGGDREPEEVVAGALEAAADGIEPILYGPAGLDTGGLPLVETTQEIAMDEKPAEAVRPSRTARSSPPAARSGEGEADAVVSAGNTGAMLAACFLELRRLPGVARPAIAVVIPAKNGPSVLLDSGANADARPEHLLQFAHMGSVFAQEVLDIARARGAPALDRRGAREGQPADARGARAAGRRRGPELRAATPRAATCCVGAADVVVCDGFTGNVVLKLLEGTIATVLDALREEITASRRGKIGGLLIRPAARGMRSRLDPDTYGGAYLLGLRGLAVIAHGNSSRRAIANAIRLAARGVEHDVVGRLAQRLPERVLASARSEAPGK